MRLNALVSLALLGITILALYCSAAGWVNAELTAALKENKASQLPKPVVFDDIQFVSEDALKRYQMAHAAKEWFPWMINLPQALSLVLTSLSFGTVGGVIRVAYDALKGNMALGGQSFGVVFLAALMGLLVLGTSYVIPAALTVSETTVRPVALLFFCLIGGAFYDHVFDWLRKNLRKLFGT